MNRLHRSTATLASATATATATAIAAMDRLLVRHLLEAAQQPNQHAACITEKYRNKCDLKYHDPGISA